MTDYINRNEVLKLVDPDVRPSLAYRIMALPAADIVERKRGKWRRNMIDGELLSYSCSECGQHLPYRYNTDFCPSCGAQMEPCENRNKVEKTMYPSSGSYCGADMRGET